MRDRLRQMLVRHEGVRLKPYKDTVGKLTIGVGRNLDDVGISQDEAMDLLRNDTDKAEDDVREAFRWFDQLDEVRQDVVISMVFNLGISRFSLFKRTIDFLAARNYVAASEEMLKSSWAKQVGQRSIELSIMMKTGHY